MGQIIKGIAHAAYTVRDMESAVAFYEKVFGFKKAFTMNHPKTGAPWIVYVYVAEGQFIELFYGGVTEDPYTDELPVVTNVQILLQLWNQLSKIDLVTY